MALLLVFIILSILVLIHEWGHYFAAKRAGIHVEEFGFGYPPQLKKLFTRKGTVFSLNWLPFGGFVRLAGDEGETFERAGEKEAEKTLGKKSGATISSKLFYEKSQAARLFVVSAGAAVNILFGVIAFAAIYTRIGIPTTLDFPRIEEILPGSPAESAGLRAGDAIAFVEDVKTPTVDQAIQAILAQRGKTIWIGILRGEAEAEMVRVYIRTAEETPAGEGALGVLLSDKELRMYPFWQMPLRGMVQGVKDSLQFSAAILRSLQDIAVQLVTRGRVPQEISGPIGIVDTVSRDASLRQGPLAILNLAALISINLGVINLLPIPALDGGRAVFIILETVLGKRRRAKIEGYANTIGMVFLFALIVLISIKDVVQIVTR